MRLRTMALLTTLGLGTWLAASAQSQKELNMISAQSHSEPKTRAHAVAKITVQSSEAQPYDRTTSPALMEIHLVETFTGARGPAGTPAVFERVSRSALDEIRAL